MKKLKKTTLSAALAFALVTTPLAGAMASDSPKSELPPQLKAMGVTQATDAELAEVKGEVFFTTAVVLGVAIAVFQGVFLDNVKTAWAPGQPGYDSITFE